MSNKINGKFYPLQHEEWVELYSTLTKSQGGVLIYLRTLDPYSNGIRIKSSKIAADLKITKRAVNSAIAVLAEKNLIEVEDAEYYLKVNSLGSLCQLEPSVTRVGSTVPTREEDFPLGKHSSHLGSTVPTREEDFPLGKHSSHLEPETFTQQEVQISKNIKINKIELDPLEAAAKGKEPKPISNDQELIPNSSLRSDLVENSPCISSYSFRSTVPQPTLENSVRHWALVFEENSSDRPWLFPPRRRDDFNFHPGFLDFHAKIWCEKFKKPDFHAARGDFRNHLINQPEKIPLYWEDFDADQKRRQDNGQLLNFNNFSGITKSMPAVLKQDFDADDARERCLALMAHPFTAREGIELAKAKGWNIEYSESGYPLGVFMPEEE